MENNNFKNSLRFTLKWEGGLVNDKDDLGGLTNFGISQKANPNVDIENITKESATKIYWQNYWMKSYAHKLGWPLCLAVFDAAVHHGPLRANRMYEETFNLNPHSNLSFANRAKLLCDIRLNFMQDLVVKRPKNKKFIKGWTNRVNDLKSKLKESKHDERNDGDHKPADIKPKKKSKSNR